MNLSLILNNLNDMEIINTTGSIATMLANLTAKPTFAEDLSLSVSIIASLNEYGYLEDFYLLLYVHVIYLQCYRNSS